MIEIRQRGTGSWLDPRSSKGLAARLSTRLIERCKGERGVVVTLTYRRDEYENSRTLYRAAQDQQHVPLFLRKVSRHLGESLKGRWFCKMEFQRGGWIHWHILILGVSRISIEALRDMWGRGHVWVDRLKPKALTYLTKYVAKPGGVPGWIYAEPPRAVKIIRVSPGFWGETESREEPAPIEDEDPYAHLEPEEPEPPEPERYTANVYEPIGSRIDRQRDCFTARDEHGRYRHLNADLGVVLLVLFERGRGIIGKRAGWLVVDATLEDLESAEAEANRRVNAQAAAASGASRGRGRVHSIKHSNPDREGIRSWIPKWLDDWFFEEARAATG